MDHVSNWCLKQKDEKRFLAFPVQRKNWENWKIEFVDGTKFYVNAGNFKLAYQAQEVLFKVMLHKKIRNLKIFLIEVLHIKRLNPLFLLQGPLTTLKRPKRPLEGLKRRYLEPPRLSYLHSRGHPRPLNIKKPDKPHAIWWVQ